jgi:hypothetical protein
MYNESAKEEKERIKTLDMHPIETQWNICHNSWLYPMYRLGWDTPFSKGHVHELGPAPSFKSGLKQL